MASRVQKNRGHLIRIMYSEFEMYLRHLSLKRNHNHVHVERSAFFRLVLHFTSKIKTFSFLKSIQV